MQALIYDGRHARLSERHPDPRPGPGDAVIRTSRAGLSGADRAICRGRLDFEGVLGHEFVGVVESVGEEGAGAADLVGTRVVGSMATFCGRCELCQAGLRQHCRARTLLGLRGRDGCLAERFVLPAGNLVPVPDSVDDDHAVFAEPLAAAVQARRQLTIEGKPYITVLGDGPLGLLTVQVMARLNASVRLVGRHPQKLALCERWGVKHRHLDDIGRRADQDVVVDCTGSPDGLSVAAQLVRPRGTIVMKTLTGPADRAIDLTPLVLNEITLVGSHCGPVSEAIGMIARGEVDVTSLISRRVRLAEAAAVLEGDGEDVKVLVMV